MTVSANKKEAFNVAVKNIEAKLIKVRGEEAKVWKKKVTTTAAVINVLWKYQSNIESVETEQVETPAVVEMLGR